MTEIICSFCRSSIVSKYYLTTHLNTNKCKKKQNEIIRRYNLKVMEIKLNEKKVNRIKFKKITRKNNPFIIHFN